MLQLTAQLYPPQDGESRGGWGSRMAMPGKPSASTRVTEEDYNYRQDKTWTAPLGGEMGREPRGVYSMTAQLEGSIRAQVRCATRCVVAAFTGNSNQDRRLKPDLIRMAQDPDLLLLLGRSLRPCGPPGRLVALRPPVQQDEIKDRPISIPNDHDIGQGNLWGAARCPRTPPR